MSDQSPLDRSPQDRSPHGRVPQDRTAQDRAAQGRTAQGRTAQGRTAQGRTAQDRTAQDRTAQDRTAQDRTAQDRSPQDRTAQDRTPHDRTAHDRVPHGGIPHGPVAHAPAAGRPLAPRVAALAFLAAGVTILALAFAIPTPALAEGTDVGPRAFPLLIGAGLTITAAINAVQCFRGSDPAHDEQAREEARVTEWRPVALLLVTLAGYVLMLEFLGYWQTTAVLFAAVARILGSRRSGRDLLVGLALALATYLLFDQLLGIHLPPGYLRWDL
ncbi:tripartite tricarboxylate transporter TctB family protein [Streptomyces endophyticus]|uniref:Tripartite tricarboxylate transporter TctB family protein n=1 Tax=Streptomyces endophyticus TaxID=714166 RepID=A0ABU6FEC4_9ACTN|nr:tripartite tricarboxylate transporter TctB family protein [Streptomyces endophyticus]MEB8342396.1 tripartite tricarboxylate transporter TctB family protein [Streptomyces endophyticus]